MHAHMALLQLRPQEYRRSPINVVVVQHQADDAVTDLVHNVVLALT